MTAALDEAIHIEVFSIDDDGASTALVPADDPVDWSDLSDTTTVEPDSTGYNFTSSVAGYDIVTATIGQASANFTLKWTARTLKFTAESQAIS
jgi:hypothetical protein